MVANLQTAISVYVLNVTNDYDDLENDVDEDCGVALRAGGRRQVRGVRVQLDGGQQQDPVDVLNGGRVERRVEEQAVAAHAQHEHQLVAHRAPRVARPVHLP